jgi:hypothetical protein
MCVTRAPTRFQCPEERRNHAIADGDGIYREKIGDGGDGSNLGTAVQKGWLQVEVDWMGLN